MTSERIRTGPATTPPPEPEMTLGDVLTQPSADPNDDLPDDQWATKNAQVAERLAEVANRLRQSTPMRASKKHAAFLQVAVAAETDEPLLVKFLAEKACIGTRTVSYDSDSKRVAKQLSTNKGAPLYRTRAGLILETTQRKAPSGISWHNLSELERQLLFGLSHEVVARALMREPIRSLKRLRECRGIGGPTIARLAGVPYCPNVAKLFRDMANLEVLGRPSSRRFGAGNWPADAPFRPHPFLRREREPSIRRSELQRLLLLRGIARSTFRATDRRPRGSAL